ncbi:MAG: DUF5683 domain-containing protein [Chitinivibrionia bacterium]|nr:DUF5683 domain-containing protein [Chitinivibrionia bacterium]
MAKYLLSTIFVFVVFAFAQELSLEEELRLLGGDIFFIADPQQQDEEALNDTDTTTALLETEGEQNGELQANEGDDGGMQAYRGSRGPGGPGFTGFSPMQGGRGGGGGGDTDTTDTPRVSVFDTAIVMSERSIDFARNVAEYRNPQRALLFSLLVPGLGQVYNRDFVRAGIYAAAEVGFIIGAVYFRRDSRRLRNEAHRHADRYFDSERLRQFYTEIGIIAQGNHDDFPQIPNDTITIGQRIFGPIITTNDPTVAVNTFMQMVQDDYYGNDFGAGSNFGVRGWNDVNPQDYGQVSFSPDGSFNLISTGGLFISWDGGSFFGTSQNQQVFHSIMDDSRRQHNRSQVFVVGIFVNHIAAATDAFISAIIHNRRLLREEKGEEPTRAQEIISRMSIESNMFRDDITGDFTSRMSLVWRF